MKTKTINLGIAALASAMMAGTASAALINPDAGGIDAVVNADVIDIAPGNALVTCVQCWSFVDTNNPANNVATDDVTIAVAGSLIQNFGQARVSALQDLNNNNVSSGNFNNAYEWTVSFGFLEVITANIPGITTNTAIIDGGVNFFEIYFDATNNANNLAGTGFDDGTLILSGSILALDQLNGVNGTTNFAPNGIFGDLDTNGANDYVGQTTVNGTGGGQLEIEIDFQNPLFFIQDITGFNVDVNTQLNLPFNAVDPSSCFDGIAGANNGGTMLGAGGGHGPCDPVASTGSIGAFNGVDGPNVMFVLDPTATITGVVPEPASVALLGIGFAAFGGLSAKRRRKQG
jgi:hypothetical protein